MPHTSPENRRKPSLNQQFALAERVLRSINKGLDEQMDRARDLQVEHAMTLYRSGKADTCDSKEAIEKLRRRIG